MSNGFKAQIRHLSTQRALHLVVTWIRANFTSPLFFTKQETADAIVASFRISYPPDHSHSSQCPRVGTRKRDDISKAWWSSDDPPPAIRNNEDALLDTYAQGI